MAGITPIFQGELRGFIVFIYVVIYPDFMWKRAPRPSDLDNATPKQEEPTVRFFVYSSDSLSN